MNKSLYITAIIGNFLLLVYAAVLIVGISGGWIDRALWLHSDVAKTAQMLFMASAMALLFLNIRTSRKRYRGKYLPLILLGNIYVNPFIGLYFLRRQANNNKKVTSSNKLTEKRFWAWIVIISLMPVMMGLFAGFILYRIDSLAELFQGERIEIFIIWEVSYLAGGLLTYFKSHKKDWVSLSFICWIITGPFVTILSFLWAGIRIHDGFGGLAYFMCSCIAWVFSLIPLLLGACLYKSYISRRN